MSVATSRAREGMATGDFGCPVCGAAEALPLIELSGLPIMCGVLGETRTEALAAPVGDVRLVACTACSMVRNAAFDDSVVDYDASYDNSLHWSPTFQAYAEGLARRLVDQYDLRGGTVVEIGSGKGDFLRLLCDLGENRGLGYDPAYDGEQADDDKLSFVAQYFDGELPSAPDLVCARHVLEHLVGPATLLSSIRRAAGPRTVVYVEVPDAAAVFTADGLWDVIYPHVGYFTATALHHLMVSSGFERPDVGTTFGGQFLYAEARAREPAATSGRSSVPARPPADDVAAALERAQGFAALHRATVERWADELESARRRGRRVALWGAGAKGATFLSTVPGGETVADVVDLNPRKHGRFVPRTGQVVIGPERLSETRPDVVLIVNPLYEAEIRESLAGLGLGPEVRVV